ncbi:hypothetical protein [Stenotrophomonas tumulicola]|uniref:Uncharacterized protein n=1 Tax=Stenotrophomonas tumulicola TaxID=1685415 RepID=A0A7W3FJ25_9GAMM|nr:hypothetical protein [Stenotrophomonas tumulicola]MBA8680493.1 hypothetical protein [Stenotrophomonas tumulicola]
MAEKTSVLLEAALRRMLDWCADNGGVPEGFTETAQAEIAFWRSVEDHTSVEFAAGMFARWQDERIPAAECR